MEMETLFSEQKWNILKCLSEEGSSPLQLAGKLNTTIANISQQLRLLEAANLVKTEKISSREKGKPRKLFSLNNDYAYMVSAMNNFADKKLLELSDHNKIILRIWFLDNPKLHYQMERFYWNIEPYLEQIKLIAINETEEPEIILISNKIKELEKNILPLIKELKTKRIGVLLLREEEAIRMANQKKGIFSSPGTISLLYDPEKILLNSLKQEGGD